MEKNTPEQKWEKSLKKHNNKQQSHYPSFLLGRGVVPMILAVRFTMEPAQPQNQRSRLSGTTSGPKPPPTARSLEPSIGTLTAS